MKQIQIESQDAGERLDRFLTRQYPRTTRSQIQKRIEDGSVLVNDVQVSKHHFLDEGDTVQVAEEVQKKSTAPVLAPPDITVLYEDDSVCVIEKPVGILVHSVPHNEPTPTIVDFLLHHVPGIETVGEDPTRPGIVHRLDKDVSGVMVTAKTQEAFDSLKKQFHDRLVQKEYRAIVHGVPVNQTDIIKFRIARSKTHGGRMAARPEHEEGRDAWTEYDVLRSRDQRYAELSVRIKTGRTHQIRVHLAAIDHPVVGDYLYTSKRYAKKRYTRLFLHAVRLTFHHPMTQKELTFKSPLPPEFDNFLKT